LSAVNLSGDGTTIPRVSRPRPVEVRVTRHLRGGYAPGYWYQVDPADPYVRSRLADGTMILRHPPAAKPEPVVEEPVGETPEEPAA